MYTCAIMELKLLYTNNKVTDWKRMSQFVCLLGLNIHRDQIESVTTTSVRNGDGVGGWVGGNWVQVYE